MSSYQKFTLKTFKGKLENGDYENATGANRAIGKTQELSEGDKAKAKAMVAAHFGTEVVKKAKPAKKVKAPAKKAKKTARAIAAKKFVKKAAKKAAIKAAPAAKPAKKMAKRAKKAAKRSKADAVTSDSEPAIHTEVAPPARAKALKAISALPSLAANAVANDSRSDTVKMMGDIISYVDVVIKTMELSKRLYPKGNIDRDVTTAQSVISKAVNVLNDVVSPMSTSDDAVAVVAKPESKKGKSKAKPNVAAAAPIEEPVEEPAIDESTFTDEEREELRVARKVQPAIDRKHGPTAALITA